MAELRRFAHSLLGQDILALAAGFLRTSSRARSARSELYLLKNRSQGRAAAIPHRPQDQDLFEPADPGFDPISGNLSYFMDMPWSDDTSLAPASPVAKLRQVAVSVEWPRKRRVDFGLTVIPMAQRQHIRPVTPRRERDRGRQDWCQQSLVQLGSGRAQTGSDRRRNEKP